MKQKVIFAFGSQLSPANALPLFVLSSLSHSFVLSPEFQINNILIGLLCSSAYEDDFLVFISKLSIFQCALMTECQSNVVSRIQFLSSFQLTMICNAFPPYFCFPCMDIQLTKEYGTGNRVSVHGDIYSYGIVLLEMLTAKGPTDSIFTDGLSLPKYVETALPERMLEVIDPRLVQELAEQNESKGECVASLLMLGLRCTQEVSANRMPARDTLKELQRIRGQLGKR